MAPEQLRGEAITHRVDIFAFGVAAYELLTNNKPFPGEIPAEILHQQMDRSVHSTTSTQSRNSGRCGKGDYGVPRSRIRKALSVYGGDGAGVEERFVRLMARRFFRYFFNSGGVGVNILSVNPSTVAAPP